MNTEHPEDALDAFAELPPGWNSYGAAPITPEAIATARAILRRLQPVPTSPGGVQLEWHGHGGDVEIEIGPSGKISEP